VGKKEAIAAFFEEKSASRTMGVVPSARTVKGNIRTVSLGDNY
jgi:hypothetical protein